MVGSNWPAWPINTRFDLVDQAGFLVGDIG